MFTIDGFTESEFEKQGRKLGYAHLQDVIDIVTPEQYREFREAQLAQYAQRGAPPVPDPDALSVLRVADACHVDLEVLRCCACGDNYDRDGHCARCDTAPPLENDDIPEGARLLPFADELESLTGSKAVRLHGSDPWSYFMESDEWSAVLIRGSEHRVLLLQPAHVEDCVANESALLPRRRRLAQAMRTVIVDQARELWAPREPVGPGKPPQMGFAEWKRVAELPSGQR